MKADIVIVFDERYDISCRAQTAPSRFSTHSTRSPLLPTLLIPRMLISRALRGDNHLTELPSFPYSGLVRVTQGAEQHTGENPPSYRGRRSAPQQYCISGRPCEGKEGGRRELQKRPHHLAEPWGTHRHEPITPERSFHYNRRMCRCHRRLAPKALKENGITELMITRPSPRPDSLFTSYRSFYSLAVLPH